MLAGQDNTRPAVGVTGGELKIGTFDGSKWSFRNYIDELKVYSYPRTGQQVFDSAH